MDKNGYFNTMVNVDRIIDDYSKGIKDVKSFTKLFSYPKSYKMPQTSSDLSLVNYLKGLLDKRLPLEEKRHHAYDGIG